MNCIERKNMIDPKFRNNKTDSKIVSIMKQRCESLTGATSDEEDEEKNSSCSFSIISDSIKSSGNSSSSGSSSSCSSSTDEESRRPNENCTVVDGGVDCNNQLLRPSRLRSPWCTEEKKLMENIFQRVCLNTTPEKREVLWIKGPTGTGKTTLARSIRESVLEDGRGYFLEGKFDPMQRLFPYAAYIDAFTDYFKQIFLSEQETARVRDAIYREGHGFQRKDLECLVALIPGLSDVLAVPATGKRPSWSSRQHSKNNKDGLGSSSASDDDASYNHDYYYCFKSAFQILVRAVCSPEKPLVLLLDDIQYAGEMEVQLLRCLIMDSSNEGILFVLTHGEKFEDKGDDFTDILPKPSKCVMNLTEISLSNLTKDQVFEIVSDAINCEQEVEYFTSALFTVTNGNFFTLDRILKSHLFIENEVCRDNSFNREDQKNCQSYERVIRRKSKINDPVLDTINVLDDKTQEFLKIASCLGSELDKHILQNFSGEVSVELFFEEMSNKGLLRQKSHDCWCFSHDKIREIIYTSIPETERSRFHYHIGRGLWEEACTDDIPHYVYLVANQFMLSSWTERTQKERTAIAEICLEAGEQSAKSSNFHTAGMYLSFAISLLDSRSWRDDYSLCLRLYNAAAEVAHTVGQIDRTLNLAEESIKHSRSIDDAKGGVSMKICSLGSSGRPHDAITTGLDLLKELGVEFPHKPSWFHVRVALFKLKLRLKRLNKLQFLDLPMMLDARHLATMKIMILIFRFALFSNRELSILLGCRLMTMSLDHGVCAMSCVAFAIYGWILCFNNHFQEGLDYGKLGLALCDKFEAKAWLARFSGIYFSSVYSYTLPARGSVAPLNRAHQWGLRSGDIEWAMACGNLSSFMQLEISRLPKLEKFVEDLKERMEFHGQRASLILAQNLLESLKRLTKSHTNDDGIQKQTRPGGGIQGSLSMEVPWFLVSFLFEDFECANIHRKRAKELGIRYLNPVLRSVVMMLDALTEIEVARMRGRKKAKEAARISKRLRSWAKFAPENFLAKHLLIEAELAAMASVRSTNISRYSLAISTARESGSLLVAALANEKACKYLARLGKQAEATDFFQATLQAYDEWGANAKVATLMEQALTLGEKDSLVHSDA